MVSGQDLFFAVQNEEIDMGDFVAVFDGLIRKAHEAAYDMGFDAGFDEGFDAGRQARE